MAKAIPVYDIHSIDQQAEQDLLIERFGIYLQKHYEHLRRPHRHSFYHMVLFTSGSGAHSIDFERFTIHPFQIYFMIPGQVHGWDFGDDVDGYIVHFHENLFKAFLQDGRYLSRFPFFQGIARDSVCNLPEAVHAGVRDIFERLIAEMPKEKEEALDLIRIKLLELFILVERAYTNKPRKKVAPQKLLLLHHFQQLIDTCFRTIRLPKEYAGLLYITPNHLNALCMELLGKTAGELIKERVLLEAKRLLTNANMSIAEIAYDLNFQDNSYFNRFFRKNVGMTPETFRKQLINH